MDVMETLKYTYVPPPCVLQLVSLRSEEIILPKVFIGGCHGNDCIRYSYMVGASSIR